MCVLFYHPYFQTIKPKVYLLSENLDQLSGLNFVFLSVVMYFSSSFALSWVDKVTTGTWSFVSVIGNVNAFVSLDNTHFQTKWD